MPLNSKVQDFGNGAVPVKQFCACGMRRRVAVLSFEQLIRFAVSGAPAPWFRPDAVSGMPSCN